MLEVKQRKKLLQFFCQLFWFKVSFVTDFKTVLKMNKIGLIRSIAKIKSVISEPRFLNCIKSGFFSLFLKRKCGKQIKTMENSKQTFENEEKSKLR